MKVYHLLLWHMKGLGCRMLNSLSSAYVSKRIREYCSADSKGIGIGVLFSEQVVSVIVLVKRTWTDIMVLSPPVPVKNQ